MLLSGVDHYMFAEGNALAEQALEIIRGCRGLNLVGADLVEVAPPYDPTGNTALLGANIAIAIIAAAGMTVLIPSAYWDVAVGLGIGVLNADAALKVWRRSREDAKTPEA